MIVCFRTRPWNRSASWVQHPITVNVPNVIWTASLTMFQTSFGKSRNMATLSKGRNRHYGFILFVAFENLTIPMTPTSTVLRYVFVQFGETVPVARYRSFPCSPGLRKGRWNLQFTVLAVTANSDAANAVSIRCYTVQACTVCTVTLLF